MPGEVSEDRAVAEAIADELRHRRGRRGGWFEVRALMAAFGFERLSDDARQRMASALNEVGLQLDPALADVDRRDTVVLSWAAGAVDGTRGDAPVDTRAVPLADVLTVRTAGSGQPMHPVALADPTPTAGVRWFNIADTRSVHADEVFAALGPHCGGQLTAEMVDDVVSPDPRPKVVHWLDGAVRGTAAFRVTAVESDEGADENSSSKAGVLVFEPVEFLVGTDWLITCWHDGEVYRGAERIAERAPAPPAELFTAVERAWPTLPVSSAGDLAVLVLHELALSYAPAYRQLVVWEDEWELDFFRRPDRIDRETLLEARAGAAVLRDWLNPLNPPGLRGDVDRAWFPGITGTPESGGFERALGVDDRIDRALRGLREFNQTLRSAYDLLQLREGERERHRDERFQRNIAVGGAAILIPTLVAGIMGVNTWVPGEAGPRSSHWAFLVLIVIIFLSGTGGWVVLHRLRDRESTGMSHLPRVRLRRPADRGA